MNRARLPDGDTYKPVAVYYEDSDSLEYIRRDEPAIYRRIDDLLTLILSMRTRETVGFQLKGFTHFYLHTVSEKFQLHGDDAFLELIVIMEEAVRSLGDKIFEERERGCAYLKAREMAKEDGVQLSRGEFAA